MERHRHRSWERSEVVRCAERAAAASATVVAAGRPPCRAGPGRGRRSVGTGPAAVVRAGTRGSARSAVEIAGRDLGSGAVAAWWAGALQVRVTALSGRVVLAANARAAAAGTGAPRAVAPAHGGAGPGLLRVIMWTSA
ncbi:hypothetical protein HBB16_21230 [Pseudonocardia sp. MCCB 268]|nr:hypothetical protein [Pseudonocardia cytotoxica]